MAEYEFTCPECGQQIDVNTPIREATLTHGCPVCGTSVSRADFTAQ
ncbi:zinc ribbon domain-containing protein [Natrononativus amylolyticus]|nr:zinc ribbon domain-containing protein [Natrononativus amylolyticus]